jgi:hypothetical protein
VASKAAQAGMLGALSATARPVLRDDGPSFGSLPTSAECEPQGFIKSHSTAMHSNVPVSNTALPAQQAQDSCCRSDEGRPTSSPPKQVMAVPVALETCGPAARPSAGYGMAAGQPLAGAAAEVPAAAPGGSHSCCGEPASQHDDALGKMAGMQPIGGCSYSSGGDGSKTKVSCELTECSCQEECSSVPSFAGWSTNAQPADKAVSAAGCAGEDGPVAAEPKQQETQHLEQRDVPLEAPMVDALPAHNAGPQSSAAAAAGTSAAQPSFHPAPAHSMGASSMGLSGHNFGMSLGLAQLPLDVGLSRDVAVLQQEVLMLRQQVG